MRNIIFVLIALFVCALAGCTAVAEPVDVTVIWTAPGDDGNEGQASLYDLRYAADSASLIANWTLCTEIPTGAPSMAGVTDTARVGLRPGEYYMAIKAVDDVGNWSPLSNIATVFIADDQPPAIVVDLRIAQ